MMSDIVTNSCFTFIYMNIYVFTVLKLQLSVLTNALHFMNNRKINYSTNIPLFKYWSLAYFYSKKTTLTNFHFPTASGINVMFLENQHTEA
jgi:hypothetical protein